MSGESSDLELDRHVTLADWKNPTPSGRYHLVVIGAGPAGLVAAAGAAVLGAEVALTKTIHSYPTQNEIIKRLADRLQRRRLTPFVKRLFARWFAWTGSGL